jgi:hypothetical protein
MTVKEEIKPGEWCFVSNDGENWFMRKLIKISDKGMFKYITYDSDSDEVEEWISIKKVNK